MTNATTEERVIELAKQSAAAYVAEFGEPLDSDAGDWDAVAWGEHDRLELGLSDDEADRLWPIYQAALVTETKRLTA